MAHDIATMGGKLARMFPERVPWHGLATVLKFPATAEQPGIGVVL